MISIQQLIQVAPFPEDKKQELLQKADAFSEEKKFALMEACWALISQQYQNRLQLGMHKAVLEMANGKKSYSQEELKKIEDDLFLELKNRLVPAENQEDISQIREKLKSQLPQ